MKVLVCGGRDYDDAFRVFGELDALEIETGGVTAVVHGAARGADSLADRWAIERGKTVERFPADWENDGRAAGPIRNRRMLKESKADLVIAFPGGRGTAHMISIARAAGVSVRVIPPLPL